MNEHDTIPDARPDGNPRPTPAHETEQRPSQDLYRELLQGLYDAVLVSTLTGEIVDSNLRAQAFFGYTGDEFNGMSMDAIIVGFNREILLQIREQVTGGRFTVLDAHCVRKNGSRFPVEIAMSQIHFTEAGNLVFSIRNIERRKCIEDMLRTERQALQNAAAGIAITDSSGRLQSVNPAFLDLWGYEREEDVKGQDIRLFWPDPGEADTLVSKPLAGETWIGEIAAIRRNGATLCLQASAAPNRNDTGQTDGMVFSFIDVTTLKRAEEAIRKEVQAQMSKAREQNDFSGLLNIVSLPDVVQLIDATHKSGTLHVLNNENRRLASIVFLEGQIVHIACLDRTGEAAMRDVLTCAGTTFRFEPHVPSERDHTITKPTMALLLDATRSIDEG